MSPPVKITREDAAKVAATCSAAFGEELPPNFAGCRSCRQPFTQGEGANRKICDACLVKYGQAPTPAKTCEKDWGSL